MSTDPPKADEPMVNSWERFFKLYQREQINEAALAQPRRRSITIDWFDLERHDKGVAQFLLDHPYQALAQAHEALKLVDAAELVLGPRAALHIRVRRLPTTHTHDVRDLRPEHLGKLVAVKGLITSRTNVQPKLQEAVFLCSRCGNMVRVPQDEHLVLQEPLECYEDQGGCGRDSKFKLIEGQHRGEQSVSVASQGADIQEPPEAAKGEQPRSLRLFLEDDICDEIEVGRRVTVTGVLRAAIRKYGGVKSTLLDTHLDVSAIVEEDDEDRAREATPAELEQVKKLAASPGALEWLVGSFAPDLIGLEAEKTALLLALVGSPSLVLGKKRRRRGEIHVLFIGDPGTAKSQLLGAAAELAPVVAQTSGKGTTGAGLTAAVRKDDRPGSEGRFMLEAGSMVLADRGFLIVDELDKIDEEHASTMHDGMESGQIFISKAGIKAVLQTRCSILAGANPKESRFTKFQPIGEQIGIVRSLLSRFDVIFPLFDELNEKRDTDLADQLLEDEPDEHEMKARALHVRLMRVWIDHARTKTPHLSPEARKKLLAHYVDARKECIKEEGLGVPYGPRQLLSIRRLALASARLHLRDIATVEDAQLAIDVVDTYLKRVGSTREGGFDIDRAMGLTPASQRRMIELLENIVSKLQHAHVDGAPEDEVVEEAAKIGLDRDRAKGALRSVSQKKRASIHSERSGYYRTTKRL